MRPFSWAFFTGFHSQPASKREQKEAAKGKPTTWGSPYFDTCTNESPTVGCNRGSWSLLPVAAHDRQHWQRGTGEVKLKLTAYGEDLLPGFKGTEGSSNTWPLFWLGSTSHPIGSPASGSLGF